MRIYRSMIRYPAQTFISDYLSVDGLKGAGAHQSLFSALSTQHIHCWLPKTLAPTQPEKRVKTGNSSDPLFTTYSKFAEDKDENMTEHWMKDADGIIIFVHLEAILCTGGDWLKTKINWFILYRRCCPCRCITPRPPTKSTGYILILSRETLSTSSWPECATPIHAIWCGHSSCILSTEICSLGELTRILEPGHQSFMRNVGDIAAAVVTPIPHDQVILR